MRASLVIDSMRSSCCSNTRIAWRRCVICPTQRPFECRMPRYNSAPKPFGNGSTMLDKLPNASSSWCWVMSELVRQPCCEPCDRCSILLALALVLVLVPLHSDHRHQALLFIRHRHRVGTLRPCHRQHHQVVDNCSIPNRRWASISRAVNGCRSSIARYDSRSTTLQVRSSTMPLIKYALLAFLSPIT